MTHDNTGRNVLNNNNLCLKGYSTKTLVKKFFIQLTMLVK